MKNVILDRHKYLSPPATHTRNTKREPIDGIWVSKSLDPIAAGFLAVGSAFSSGHVALWVDFRREDLLGTRVGPTTHSINRMKADDPRLVSKYNQLSLKALNPIRVKEQLQALSVVPRSLWQDDNKDKYNELLQITTAVRKEIGANIRHVRLGNVPWSPQLQRFYDRIELMKMLIQKRLGVRTSMTKIRRLLRVTGAWNALKANLQTAKTLLNDAFKSYKEAKLLAPEWRENHLDALDLPLTHI